MIQVTLQVRMDRTFTIFIQFHLLVWRRKIYLCLDTISADT